MGENLRIVEEVKFIECRFCDYLVSSESPICKNCGLETSSEGIIELAKIEEFQAKEFSKIYRLRVLSVINFTTLFIGIVYTFFGIQYLFTLFFWLGIILYFAGYLLWKITTSEKKFSQEEILVVKEELSIFFGTLIVTTIIGIFFYIFLLR